VGWLNQIPSKEEVVNLFMDYETFGEHQWAETGIFEFLKALPAAVLKKSDFTFSTPSEVAKKLQVIAAANVPNPISWADEERDITAWLGNEMQQEAFEKLYSLSQRVYAVNDKAIRQDFTYLQVSDHFYYMSTKFFSDGDVHSYFNPYDTPYDAFINYMNILSDFEIRVNALAKAHVTDDIAKLSKIIKEKDEQLERLEKQLMANESADTENGKAAKKSTKTGAKSTPPSKTTASKAKPSKPKTGKPGSPSKGKS